MRPILILSFVAACAHAPDASPRPCPAAPAVASPSPSEESFRQWSHDVLDAYDRADIPSFERTLAPGFIHFEGSAPTTRETELAQLARRKPGAPRIVKRVWAKEHAYVRPDSAVFIGEATEHMGGNDVHGGNDFTGWYTLVWGREAGTWKVSLWSWQKGGEAAERDTWNEMYRRALGFNKEPNRLLVESLGGVKPGAALDVAMGQGRNALYLASRGWKVTGVDFSDEGIRLAREAATKQALMLEAVNADIDTYDFGAAKWDLVTMIYAGNSAKWIEKIKPSLRRGGLFVLEYFHKESQAGDGFATGQLAALFKDGFEIVRDEVVEGTPDWAMDHATLVRFVARKR